jgi:antitoxin (DNA-binding transcriptional repressor) of toxin-antitoxin stability system
LVKLAAAGEEVIITRGGEPVARLVCYEKPRRKPGGLKGKIWISPDFDADAGEIEALFRDGPIEPE